MIELPQNLLALEWVMILFLGGIVIHFLKKKDKSIEEHDRALKENTFALIKVSVQLENVVKQIEKIPELEKDIANLGASIRSMRNGSSNHEPNN
jgi:hypothetical protein